MFDTNFQISTEMPQCLPILLLVSHTLAKKPGASPGGFFADEDSVVNHDNLPFYQRPDFLYTTVPVAAAALGSVCCILCCTLYARHGLCHLFDFPKRLRVPSDDHFLAIDEFLELERRRRLGLPADSLLALTEQRRAEAEAEAEAEAAQHQPPDEEVDEESAPPHAEDGVGAADEAAVDTAPQQEPVAAETGVDTAPQEEPVAAEGAVGTLPQEEPAAAEGAVGTAPQEVTPTEMPEQTAAAGGAALALPLPLPGAGAAVTGTGDRARAMARVSLSAVALAPEPLGAGRSELEPMRAQPPVTGAADPLIGHNTTSDPAPVSGSVMESAPGVPLQTQAVVSGVLTADGRYVPAAVQPSPYAAVPLGWPTGTTAAGMAAEYDGDGRRMKVQEQREFPPPPAQQPLSAVPTETLSGRPAADPRQVMMTPAGAQLYTPAAAAPGSDGLQTPHYDPRTAAVRPDLLAPLAAPPEQRPPVFDTRQPAATRFDSMDPAAGQFAPVSYFQQPERFDRPEQHTGMMSRRLDTLPVSRKQSWSRFPYSQTRYQVLPTYEPAHLQADGAFDDPRREMLRRPEQDAMFPLDMRAQHMLGTPRQHSPMPGRSVEALAGGSRPDGGLASQRVVTGPDGQMYLIPTSPAQRGPALPQYEPAVAQSPLGLSPRGMQSPRLPPQSYTNGGVQQTRVYEPPALPTGLYGLPSEAATAGDGQLDRRPAQPAQADLYGGMSAQPPGHVGGQQSPQVPDGLYSYRGHKDKPAAAADFRVLDRGPKGSLSRMSHSLRQLVSAVKERGARSRSQEPSDAPPRPRGSAGSLMDRIRSMRGVSEPNDQVRLQEMRRRQQEPSQQRRRPHREAPSQENLPVSFKPEQGVYSRSPRRISQDSDGYGLDRDLEDGEYPGTPQQRQQSSDSDKRDAPRQRSRSPVVRIKQEPPSPPPPIAEKHQPDPVQYVLEEHNGKKRIVAVMPRQAMPSHRASSDEEPELKPAPKMPTKRRKVKPRLTARSSEESVDSVKKHKSKAKKKKKKHIRKQSSSSSSSSSDSSTSDSSSQETVQKAKKKKTSGTHKSPTPSRERVYSDDSYDQSDGEELGRDEQLEESVYRDRGGSRASSAMLAPRERSQSTQREECERLRQCQRDHWRRCLDQGRRYPYPCRPGYRRPYQQMGSRGHYRPGQGGSLRNSYNNKNYNYKRRHSPVRSPDDEPAPWTQTDLNRHGQPRRRPVVFQNDSLRAFVSLPPRPRVERGRPFARCVQRRPASPPLQTNQSFMQRAGAQYGASPPVVLPCRLAVGPRTPPLPRPGTPSTPPQPAGAAVRTAAQQQSRDPRLCAALRSPARTDPRLSARSAEEEKSRDTQLRRLVYAEHSQDNGTA